MSCKGICERHKFQRGNNGGYYIHGGKRCSMCSIFIKWDGVFCPCCGYQLRIGPHLTKDKRKFRRNKELMNEGKSISKIRLNTRAELKQKCLREQRRQ